MRQQGSAMIILLAVLLAVTLLCMSLFESSVLMAKSSAAYSNVMHAFNLADSALMPVQQRIKPTNGSVWVSKSIEDGQLVITAHASYRQAKVILQAGYEMTGKHASQIWWRQVD